MKKSNLVICSVIVNRKRSPKDALNATNRNQYVSTELIDEIPKGEKTELDMFFFYCRNKISHEALEEKYEFYNLKCDPIAQCSHNEVNPGFANTYPNACQWKDSKGNWVNLDFDSFKGELRVGLRQYGVGFAPGYWFGGVPK